MHARSGNKEQISNISVLIRGKVVIFLIRLGIYGNFQIYNVIFNFIGRSAGYRLFCSFENFRLK